MITIPIKRGDTLLWTCTYTIDGKPAPLPENVRAQLRDKLGALVAELGVERTDPDNGQYTLGVAAGLTQAWPLVRLFGDIEYADADGRVQSTETFSVVVMQDITHD